MELQSKPDVKPLWSSHKPEFNWLCETAPKNHFCNSHQKSAFSFLSTLRLRTGGAAARRGKNSKTIVKWNRASERGGEKESGGGGGGRKRGPWPSYFSVSCSQCRHGCTKREKMRGEQRDGQRKKDWGTESQAREGISDQRKPAAILKPPLTQTHTRTHMGTKCGRLDFLWVYSLTFFLSTLCSNPFKCQTGKCVHTPVHLNFHTRTHTRVHTRINYSVLSSIRYTVRCLSTHFR